MCAKIVLFSFRLLADRVRVRSTRMDRERDVHESFRLQSNANKSRLPERLIASKIMNDTFKRLHLKIILYNCTKLCLTLVND